MSDERVTGLLVIDKPVGITSRHAVNVVARWFPRDTRIGHTGTLDPLASGVLVLCLGSATRLVEYVQRMDKVYHTHFMLGGRSDTNDAEGHIESSVVRQPPTLQDVLDRIGAFVGHIDQVPPTFSAARVAGRRAYDLARRGREVALASRRVQIYEIQILEYAYPELTLQVACGKGTYVRALARDLGEAIGCGAWMESLRRLRVGPFGVEEALPLSACSDEIRPAILPLQAALHHVPTVVIDDERCAALRLGQGIAISAADFDCPETHSLEIAVLDSQRRLVAVAAHEQASGLARPLKVFHSTG